MRDLLQRASGEVDLALGRLREALRIFTRLLDGTLRHAGRTSLPKSYGTTFVALGFELQEALSEVVRGPGPGLGRYREH